MSSVMSPGDTCTRVGVGFRTGADLRGGSFAIAGTTGLSCKINSAIHRIGFKINVIGGVMRNNQSCRMAMSFSGINMGGVFTNFTGLGGV